MNLEIGKLNNNYVLDEDGMVWYGQGKDARLVVPSTMRNEVLEANHDYLLAGHGGIGDVCQDKPGVLLAKHAERRNGTLQ